MTRRELCSMTIGAALSVAAWAALLGRAPAMGTKQRVVWVTLAAHG